MMYTIKDARFIENYYCSTFLGGFLKSIQQVQWFNS